MSLARFSGKISFATFVHFFPSEISSDVSNETSFSYHSTIFFATMSPARSTMSFVNFVGEPFFLNRGWFSEQSIFCYISTYGSKSGILVEIDFAPNDTFFAILILYGSKSGIMETSLDMCHTLKVGDPGEISLGGRLSLPIF
jgi:hypothetical protein